MERRDLLKMILATTGLALIGADAWAAGAKAPATAKPLFTADDVALLDDIAETILPRTNTPGAKDAGCGAQMAVMVQDCYTANQQMMLVAGLAALQARCKKQHRRDFLQLNHEDKTRLLTQLDLEAKGKNKHLGDDEEEASVAPHYFTMLKQLTIFVFFTSKIGATEVLRYVAVPGRYDGAYPYKKGDRAFAT